MYRATVSLSTSCPSFANSLAIRRRLHNGFSLDIRSMSATIPASSGGRPTRLDLWAQKRANPRRCQETTVAGLTIRASTQRDQTRESTDQKARSTGCNRGRATVRRRTASCCRRARFSITRFALGRTSARSAPRTAVSLANTTPVSRLGSHDVTGESARLFRYPRDRALFSRAGRVFRHHSPTSDATPDPIAA